MELNKIVSQVLSGPFPRQQFVFTINNIQWELDSRIPKKTFYSLTITGRLQQVTASQIQQNNFNIQEFQYFQLFIDPLTPDKATILNQNGSSVFEYEKEKYQIVGSIKWPTNKWQQLFCYKINNEANNEI